MVINLLLWMYPLLLGVVALVVVVRVIWELRSGHYKEGARFVLEGNSLDLLGCDAVRPESYEYAIRVNSISGAPIEISGRVGPLIVHRRTLTCPYCGTPMSSGKPLDVTQSDDQAPRILEYYECELCHVAISLETSLPPLNHPTK